MGQPYFVETGCNFANDPDDTTDPDLQTTDWDATQANSWTRSNQATETPLFIRFQFENTGTKDQVATSWELWMNTVDDSTAGGGATKVTTATSPISIVNDGGSNNIADQATCDARRCGTSPSAYTWSDGKYCDASDAVGSVGLVQAYYTEVMFCIEGASGAAGNTYYFWVYPEAAEADSYDGSNTATVTFTAAAGGYMTLNTGYWG